MKYLCEITNNDIEIIKTTRHFQYIRLWNHNVYKKKIKDIISIRIGTDEYVLF